MRQTWRRTSWLQCRDTESKSPANSGALFTHESAAGAEQRVGSAESQAGEKVDDGLIFGGAVLQRCDEALNVISGFKPLRSKVHFQIGPVWLSS
jgi:hypothetical protein